MFEARFTPPDPEPQDEPASLKDVLRGILIRAALRETDETERAAKVQILQNDGWL